MKFLAYLVIWINAAVNAVSKFLLAPIGVLPGWLSITIISAVTGLFLMIIFKYTSNQTAIGKVRDNIKANMLALKLYKDSMSVTLQAQGQVFKGAFLLLFHAVRPMLVMIVPVSLLLAQMGLWYQYRPLLVGEQAMVTMQLNGNMESPWPKISIESTPSAEVVAGPVRVLSKRQIYWQIKAHENTSRPIVFQVDNHRIEKEFAIGDGFTPVSIERPGLHWSDILMNPAEKPFVAESVVNSISIDYPDRPSKICGTDWWVVYFFVVSMVFALIFKPFLKVRI